LKIKREIMANYKAVSTGVWNALARWQDDSSGSYVASTVLPGVNDVVYANGFTVTLDIDIAVLELRTTSGVSVNAGGGFTYGAGCNTVIANLIAGTSICLTHSLTTTKTLIGNSTGGQSANAHGTLSNGNGGLIFVGNMTGGSALAAEGIRNGNGTVLATGSATGGSGTSSAGGANQGAGTFIIIGAATGGTGTAGNVGASNASSGTMFVDTAISSSIAAGVSCTSSSGVTVVKTAQSSQQGVVPISGFVFFDSTVPNSITVRRNNNTDLTLVDSSIGNPIESDVRSGITYASGALTGTLNVPPASAVAVGVPVDNTNGTAMIDINQMGALITSFKIS
jgi:hypothetical protein